MKAAIVITLISIFLLANPTGKAAMNQKKMSEPLEEISSKVTHLKNKVEELDSLLSTPR